MSVERNRGTVNGVLQALQDGRAEALDQLVAEDVLDHAAGEPGAGREGVKKRLIAFREAFERPRIEVLDELAAADRVVQRTVVRARHRGPFLGVPATGHSVAWGITHWWRLEDGRVVERWAIADLLGLLVQLGAVASPGGAERAT